MIENRHNVDDKGNPNKPQLRKKPGSGNSGDADSKGDDERLTLKRR